MEIGEWRAFRDDFCKIMGSSTPFEGGCPMTDHDHLEQTETTSRRTHAGLLPEIST